jgi:hypothetical protein
MSQSANPPRRFLPQPVETSERKARRFNVEPVETTSRSNKAGDHGATNTKESMEPQRSRFAPEPVETTVKSSRRFNVEPVETSIRSSRAKDENAMDTADASKERPTRRFAPEPIEMTTKSSRKQACVPGSDVTPKTSPKGPAEVKPRRKFTPQLIETVQRTKRQGDNRPATLPTDKTDITPGTNHIYLPRHKPKRPIPFPIAPDNTPLSSTGIVPTFPPRRMPSMRPHPNSRRSTRQNSFQPDLDVIESSESSEGDRDDEDDGMPSLSCSYGSSEDSHRLQLARTRESCDDRFAGYLLDLAAKAAEKQLHEQAEAAFANSDFHEIVEHFYDRESDDDIVTGIGLLGQDDEEDLQVAMARRKSTEVGWAQREMQQHQELLQRQREEEKERIAAEEARETTSKGGFWTAGMTYKVAGEANGGQEDELKKMRNAASPPMLGGDLKFRMCPSPKATKLETDQPMDISLNRRDDGGGLWGGYCVADEAEQWLSPAISRGPAMISTPGIEKQDPFASAFGSEAPKECSRPGSSKSNKGGLQLLTGLDERLKAHAGRSKLEEEIAREFDDKFVTQVYNYLSLGYPSLARAYDDELSRISQVPKEELARDDEVAKGHLGISEGAMNLDTIRRGPHCKRWVALKLYIFEWARQHPSLSQGVGTHSAWGVSARRGSWAI